jgi:hypothetical protein
MLDATLVVVEDSVPVAAEPQASAAGAPQESVAVWSSSVPQAVDSTVGTEGSMFSLREPLVCVVDAPRPLPPLPRSAPPRVRPRPPSAPDRPPREVAESANGAAAASLALALGRDLSFLTLETSPHCVIDPI